MVIIRKAEGSMRAILVAMGSVALVILGFIMVLFSSSSKSDAAQSHMNMFGADIAHADAPASSGDGISTGDGFYYIDPGATGCGTGGCSAGCGDGAGAGAGDGSGDGGCGTGSSDGI